MEFDPVGQEQNLIQRSNTVKAVEGSMDQLKASQRMDNEQDSMTKMQSEYGLERAKLDAGKAEVLSAIDGEKARIR